MVKEENKPYKEVYDQALELKDDLGLSSIEVALLLIIQGDVDLIRFHNTE